MKTFDHLAVIGLREWIALPELGLAGLRAKINTGAATSTQHPIPVHVLVQLQVKWPRGDRLVIPPNVLKERVLDRLLCRQPPPRAECKQLAQ